MRRFAYFLAIARRLAPPREARSGTSRRNLASAKYSNALKAKRVERKGKAPLTAQRVERKGKAPLTAKRVERKGKAPLTAQRFERKAKKVRVGDL